MGNELARRCEIGVNLPGTRRITKHLPPEMFDCSLDKAIQHAVQENMNGPDADVARRIGNEIANGAKYTIFVSKGNEQYKVEPMHRVGDLFEIDPTTARPRYGTLTFTVSKTRTGG